MTYVAYLEKKKKKRLIAYQLSPHGGGGGVFISNPFERRGLFIVEKTMVSVLHKEPRIQSGNAQVQ